MRAACGPHHAVTEVSSYQLNQCVLVGDVVCVALEHRGKSFAVDMTLSRGLGVSGVWHVVKESSLLETQVLF